MLKQPQYLSRLDRRTGNGGFHGTLPVLVHCGNPVFGDISRHQQITWFQLSQKLLIGRTVGAFEIE